MIYLETQENFGKVMKALTDESITLCSLDLETTGLDPFFDDILLMQIKLGEEIFVFNWRKLGKDFMKYVTGLLRYNDHLTFLAHNARFEAEFLAWNTGHFLENLYCTMIVEQLLGAGYRLEYSLKDTVKKYLDIDLNKEIRESFIGYEGEDFSEEQLKYAIDDVLYLEKIRELQMEEIKSVGMTKVMVEENKFVTVLAATKIHGMKLNVEKWRILVEKAEKQEAELKKELNSVAFDSLCEKFKFKNAFEVCEKLKIPVKTKRERLSLETIEDLSLIKDYVVENLNLGSKNQTLVVLNELYELDAENTNAKTLAKIRHPFLTKLKQYREFKKSAESFGENYIQKINPVTGRIHYNIKQLGAATGRTSCEKPNLQNIKREAEYREPWEAEYGWVLVDADYSGEEYRITGSASKEPAIIKAYKEGQDMHTVTAMNVFNLMYPKDVTKELRAKAKTYNFAIIYGANAWGLSYALDIPVEEAKKIINNFYSGYPVLTTFKQKFEKFVLKYKYSVTLFGRRRYFEDRTFFPGGSKEREHYERMLQKEGFNHHIQGSAADIIKIAMNRLYYECPYEINIDFKILLTVHDEILVETLEGLRIGAEAFMEKIMLEAEQPFLGEIPAQVEVKSGKVWEH